MILSIYLKNIWKFECKIMLNNTHKQIADTMDTSLEMVLRMALKI